MRIAAVTGHYISPSENGSQVSCWAMLEYLLGQGHEVINCPFIDDQTSTNSWNGRAAAEELGLKAYPVVYSATSLKEIACSRGK